MLPAAGDPFTRLLPADQASAFQSATSGELITLGFQVTDFESWPKLLQVDICMIAVAWHRQLEVGQPAVLHAPAYA